MPAARDFVLAILLLLLAIGPLAAEQARAQQGDFRTLGTFRGALVETAARAGAPTRVRASRRLAVPCAPVIETLLDVAGFKRWISFADWSIVAQPEGALPVMHGSHAMPFPFAMRDYVVAYQSAQGAAFELSSRSVEQGPKPADGTVRLRVRSLWSARAASVASCDVSYEYDGDLGGSFPTFLLEGVWQEEGPKLLEGLLGEALHRAAGHAGVKQ